MKPTNLLPNIDPPIVNEYDRTDYRAPFGDVSIKEAMIAWNAADEDYLGTPGQIAVIPWPDEKGRVDRLKLANTVGACAFQSKNKKDWMLNLMIEAWHIACRDRVPLQNIHEALMVIPEYRSTLSGERFFRRPKAPEGKPGPSTTEIVYTWPNGREEVRYRRPKDSPEALEMIAEVLDLKRQHGKDCPYDFRNV